MKILITGTPGTGKTEVAKILTEHYGYEYVHIGDHDDYISEKTDVKIVDVDKMIKWLKKKEGNLIVESHLSHYYPEAKICIILRCDPAELKNRLKKRGYSDDKIKINTEAEAMDLILQEALAEGHKVYEIDTTNKTASLSSEEAIKAIDKGLTNYGKINYTHYLTKSLKKRDKKE